MNVEGGRHTVPAAAWSPTAPSTSVFTDAEPVGPRLLTSLATGHWDPPPCSHHSDAAATVHVIPSTSEAAVRSHWMMCYQQSGSAAATASSSLGGVISMSGGRDHLPCAYESTKFGEQRQKGRRTRYPDDFPRPAPYVVSSAAFTLSPSWSDFSTGVLSVRVDDLLNSTLHTYMG